VQTLKAQHNQRIGQMGSKLDFRILFQKLPKAYKRSIGKRWAPDYKGHFGSGHCRVTIYSRHPNFDRYPKIAVVEKFISNTIAV